MHDLADQLTIELPYLRRYARALTGAQASGDDLAYETLQRILNDRTALIADTPLRVAVFRIFHQQWTAMATAPSAIDQGDHAHAQKRLADLAPDSREALLLSTIEEFTSQQVSIILDTDIETVHSLIARAKSDMKRLSEGLILIIEDEPIIASDLSRIVELAGHRVTGVGRTREEAVKLGKKTKPDLILADIQLADGSSGIDATHDLMKEFGGVPVIFITAFPERLLTGNRPEPAFLISKPYNESHVTSAVSQAMFFATTVLLAKP
ncbi:response regulator [Loktanella sp. F6476L]|uniref:response regulator n=1 Tax=Loktanella sp. F6476L TaxID=2926405 RepID=UPI001FF3D2D8|nr:response regulator [Loktanella sp. F6476L]MCK0120447.1 response regulator [Loktanella sp. F6476L]